MSELLAQHVREAAARADIREAVARLYGDLQREIDARKPICSASGKCCRFEEYGHRLYVSTLELAAFVAQVPAAHQEVPVQSRSLPVLTTPGCPFQVDNLCSVHPIRPFGCRMFFCDPTAADWQNERYEHFHAELKRLHELLDVPYFYVEWRTALAALGLRQGDKVLG